ncbi:MAG: transposase [Actinomycetota bacterium]
MAVPTDPDVIAGMGYEAFAAAVSAELARWGGKRRSLRIVRAVFAAASAPSGVGWEREASADRAAFAVSDWHRALDALDEVERRMVEVLDALDLTELVTIHGLSAVGAAAILAGTGDPDRFDCARTWARHAGLRPLD